MAGLRSASFALLLLSGTALAAPGTGAATAGAASAKAADVLKTYGDIAHAMYEDSATTAKSLRAAVAAFLADPTPAKLNVARAAWKAARVPYAQTEGFRFGNAIVNE